ncbi:MAG: PadR family transcriptional regulator [Vicinamibacteria bacterium]
MGKEGKDETLDLVKGSLDVLILKTLSRGPAHGYAISRWIRTVTREALRIEEGALYPALHRLEARGWIVSEWGVSENNRKARFYRLTPKGAKHLERESSAWRRFSRAMGRVLDSPEEAG